MAASVAGLVDRGVDGWYKAIEIPAPYLSRFKVKGKIVFDSRSWWIVRVSRKVKPSLPGAAVVCLVPVENGR